MTDLQVSNARRIGFTALAVVAFWVVAWQAYEGGFVSIMLADLDALFNDTPRPGIPVLQFATVTVAYATLPVLFLSLAAYNSPVRAGRCILIVVTSGLVVGTVASSLIVGMSDFREMAEGRLIPGRAPRTSGSQPPGTAAAPRRCPRHPPRRNMIHWVA